jgi:hypothetical protein
MIAAININQGKTSESSIPTSINKTEREKRPNEKKGEKESGCISMPT